MAAIFISFVIKASSAVTSLPEGAVEQILDASYPVQSIRVHTEASQDMSRRCLVMDKQQLRRTALTTVSRKEEVLEKLLDRSAGHGLAYIRQGLESTEIQYHLERHQICSRTYQAFPPLIHEKTVLLQEQVSGGYGPQVVGIRRGVELGPANIEDTRILLAFLERTRVRRPQVERE